MAVLEYPNSCAIISSCSRQKNANNSRMIRIVGTDGIICFSPIELFDNGRVVIQLKLAKDAPGIPAGDHTLKFPVQTDRYMVQLNEFACMVRGEMDSPYSFEHDYLVHEATLAAAGYIQWQK